MQTSKSNPPAARPVRFLHIPKTAGTSLNVFLDRFYPVNSIFVFKSHKSLADNLAILRNRTADEQRLIGLYRGHAPLIVGDPHVDGARTFTFLRDPVRRIVSFCHHLAEGKEKSHMLSPPSDCPSGSDFKLDAFLSSGEPELENLQTRMLVGEHKYRSLKQSGDMQELREALAAAFSRIEFVGVQEHFGDGLLLASLLYGWWPAASFTKKMNVRAPGNRLPFNEGHLDFIRNLNLMDAEAHRMACSIYHERRRRMGGALFGLKLRIRCHTAITSLRARAGLTT